MTNLVNTSEITKILEEALQEGIQRFAVAAAILVDGKILLAKRDAGDFMGGFWELPGGHLEENENLFDALVREIAEETNLEVVEISEYWPAFDYDSDRGGRTRQLNFVVRVQDATRLNLSPEHSQTLWIDRMDFAGRGKIPMPELSPEMKGCISRIFQSRLFDQ